MQLYQTLYQWKTDTASHVLAFNLIEAFEYLPLFVDRNTDTGITDLQYQIVIFLFQGNSDTLSAFRIFESIWKQVVDYQFQIIGIEQHFFVFQLGMESIGYLFMTCQLIIEQEIIMYQLVGILFLYL